MYGWNKKMPQKDDNYEKIELKYERLNIAKEMSKSENDAGITQSKVR